MKHAGRKPKPVIGVTADGCIYRWIDIHAAAQALGTTPGTLRVYIHYDRPYKCYWLDYEPDKQISMTF